MNGDKKKKKKKGFKVFTVLRDDLNVNIPDFEKDARLEWIVNSCDKFYKDNNLQDEINKLKSQKRFSTKEFLFRDIDNLKKKVNKIVKNNQIGLNDVERFMNEEIFNFQPLYDKNFKNLGAYMTPLVNYAVKNDRKFYNMKDFICISLQTGFLPEVIDMWGFDLKENISLIINGDSGSTLGYSLDGGRIELIGNAGTRTGDCAKRGEIEIYGNTDKLLGTYNQDAKITVHGNAGYRVGDNMEGGRVEIEKEAGSIGALIDGKIIVNGKIKDPYFIYGLYKKKDAQVWVKSKVMNMYKEITGGIFSYKTYDSI